MFYELIKLKGYKRISYLNKIDTIQITPESKFHWILGTNGSGKSSLMEEISPLAATPSNYEKGGYKLIHIFHNGKDYRLLSDFSGTKNIFSFIVIENGEEKELNQGHTSTVFNNLVFQHFGYTKELHEFNLGKRNFTTMSPSDRKTWMTKLSDADYTFALNYFKKLFTAYRDTQGAVKTDHNRLLEAKAKVLKETEIENLKSELSILKEKMDFLMQVCPNPSISYDVVKNKAEQLQRNLIELRNKQRKFLKQNIKFQPLGERSDVEAKLKQSEKNLAVLDSKINTIFERLETIKKELNLQQQILDVDALSLKSSLNTVNNEIEKLKSSFNFKTVSKPKETIMQFQGWLAELESIVPELVEDQIEECNDENLMAYKQKYEQLQMSIAKIQNLKQKAYEDIQEIKNHTHDENITCPQCSFKWIPGKTQADLQRIETLLTNLKKEEVQTASELEVITQKYLKQVNYKKGFDLLMNFIWKYENFKNFWDEILRSNLHKVSPNAIKNNAFFYKEDLEKNIVYEEKLLEKAEIENKLKLLQLKSDQSFEYLVKENNILNDKLNDCYKQKDILFNEFVYLEEKIKVFDFLDYCLSESKRLKEDMDRNFILEFEYYQREQLGKFWIETQNKILSIEKQLKEVDNQKSQIELLERNLEETKTFSELLKAAVNELSPATGLIAKGLMGFMNHFVKLVNKIISKVWLYPMELSLFKPDENNEVDIDYYFPVMVKGEKVPDISLTSSGQQEIINLAMRIVALSFLRMDNGPLFLDEFGARMDTAHKASAFEMVSQLLSTSNFSQIFMISHFEGTHTEGLEADITVLCNANIQLPANALVNKNTLIT